ncbi:MAG: peptidylprolyl isomerase [Sphingorhabdus sp.]|nr:peptidylprolyl isomerase [Sphingorhabdus sp.]
MAARPFLSFALLLTAGLSGMSPAWAQESPATPAATPGAPPVAASPVQADLENLLYLDLSTGGRVTIQLYPQLAPAHVERIKTLARSGFYDGIIFHRVIEGFMAQTGDPTGTGAGDSDLPDLKAEFNPAPHLRGTVSMARTDDENSANSQFFICFQPRYSLDNKYTVFGRVTGGMAFVDSIARGEPAERPDRIVQASVAADGKPAPAAAPAESDAAPITAPPISISG